MSASRKGRRWTGGETQRLMDNYGLMDTHELARKLRRSKNSIIAKARSLGGDTRYVPGVYTVKEAAVAAEVTMHIVRHAVEKGLITPTGDGKSMFLSPVEVEKLRRLYPPAPFRSMTMPQARKRLGYCDSHMRRLLDAGLLRGVKRGLFWYLDARSVEALAHRLLKSGATRMDLRGFPSMDSERERARLYARTRRKERRHADRETTWMTLVAARQALGIRRDALRELLESGRLPGKRENGLWLVLRAAVDGMKGTEETEATEGTEGAGEVDNA